MKTLKWISLTIRGGLVTDILQESEYHFRLFDRYAKLADQGVTVQQLLPLQFVNAHQVDAEHALDVVYFDLVGGGVLKNQFMIDQV